MPCLMSFKKGAVYIRRKNGGKRLCRYLRHVLFCLVVWRLLGTG